MRKNAYFQYLNQWKNDQFLERKFNVQVEDWDFLVIWNLYDNQIPTYPSVTGAESDLKNRPQWGRIGFD